MSHRSPTAGQTPLALTSQGAKAQKAPSPHHSPRPGGLPPNPAHEGGGRPSAPQHRPQHLLSQAQPWQG